MSAPSTCCTRPSALRPNAATPCSRPPSRRCAGSASVPGASARSPPQPSSCGTISTTAPHDHQPAPSRYWEWLTEHQLYVGWIRLWTAQHHLVWAAYQLERWVARLARERGTTAPITDPMLADLRHALEHLDEA